jgi:hypothetical protein
MARLLLSMIIVLSCPVSAEVLAGETGKDVEKDGAESQEKGKSVESPKGSPSKGEEKLPEVQLEDMVLTATRSMQSREDVPGSVVVVPFRELMAKHFHGTDEALKDSLGIYNRRTKGMMDIMPSLSLRGIDLKRCLVLVDGHRRKDWLTIRGSGVWWGREHHHKDPEKAPDFHFRRVGGARDLDERRDGRRQLRRLQFLDRGASQANRRLDYELLHGKGIYRSDTRRGGCDGMEGDPGQERQYPLHGR